MKIAVKIFITVILGYWIVCSIISVYQRKNTLSAGIFFVTIHIISLICLWCIL